MSITSIKIRNIIFRRRGSIALWLIHFIFGVAMGIFFKRIELYNSANLPKDGGLIFVSNHPNALIDPALLFVALPRKIAFLAKSTLFKMPVIGYLVKTVGALPLYRQQDSGADVSKNQETFGVARELLKKGGAIAIFPEGISHDKPQLQPLKTGAARIALGAVSSGKNPESLTLNVVPVGLFYTDKTTFRSEALLHFGTPFPVFPAELDEHGQPPREVVKELTWQIERGLREVTLNADSDSEIAVARIAEEVITSSTSHTENLAERLEFLKNFISSPEVPADAELEKRLAEYDRKLEDLKLGSEFLALADYSKRFVLKQALIRSWYLVLLAPFAILGAILHFPAYQLGRFMAWSETKKGYLDMASTMKLLTGLVLIPLTWIIFATVLFFLGFGWMIALLSVPFSFICGWIALRSLEEIADLSGWLRAISVFFLKREKFLRLLAERRRLFEKVSR